MPNITVMLMLGFILFQNKPISERIIIFDSPEESPCLCGNIRIYANLAGEGFLIEETNSEFDHVLRSTVSDKNGYFAFPKASAKEMHYICASQPDFQTKCVKVKISKKAKRKLSINVNFK